MTMTNFKTLLLASVATVALTGAAQADWLFVNQYAPDLYHDNTNSQTSATDVGNASVTGASQVISHVDNSYSTGVNDDLDIEQIAGEAGFSVDSSFVATQEGENDLDADVDDLGDATVAGSQAIQNSLNSINIAEVASPNSEIFIQQQDDFGIYSSQQANNDADARTDDGDATADVNQSGRNFLNTASVSADGSPDIQDFRSEQFFRGPSEQSVDNWAESETDFGGNSEVTARQLGVNVANTVSVDTSQSTGDDEPVAIAQIAEQIPEIFGSDSDWEPTQSVENWAFADNNGYSGDASATITQDAQNQTNVANVEGNVGTLSLLQFNEDLNQEAENVGIASAGDTYVGDASVVLGAGQEASGDDPDADGYVPATPGGGQVALNFANSATISDQVDFLDMAQTSGTEALDNTDGTNQSAENYLAAYAGENGDASITAATLGGDTNDTPDGETLAARGQVAFNSLNSLTADFSTIDGGTLDQIVVGHNQAASNAAVALADVGSASITGLSQFAGGSVNTVSMPSSN
jgi:hypothetical protein